MKVEPLKIKKRKIVTSRSLPVRVLFFIFTIFFIATGAIIWSVYYKHQYKGPVAAVAKILPVPVAMVESEAIFFRDVADLSSFFATYDTQDPLLNAIERQAHTIRLQHLASELGITADESYGDRVMYSQDDLEAFLQATGWTRRQFDEYVHNPFVLALSLEQRVAYERDLQKGGRRRAQQVLEDVKEGILFSDLAEQYSESSSSQNGGNIGYVSQEDLPDIWAPVFDLDIDEISDILDIGDAYVIAQVYDKIEQEDDVLVGLRIISIKKDPLPVIVKNRAIEEPARIFLR